MDVATGGKVWRVPEPVKPAPVSQAQPQTFRPNIAKEDKSPNKSMLFMLFAVLIPLGSLPLVAYFLLLPIRTAGSPQEVENFAGGYNSMHNVFPPLETIVITVSLICLLAICVYCFNRTDELMEMGAIRSLAMGFVSFVIFMAPATIETLTGNIGTGGFSEWAKEKYSLTEIDKLGSDSTTLKAATTSGEEINYNIFRKGDIVYLYETDAQLVELTQRIAKGPDS